MPLFRRETIFHTEDRSPDPEELNLRFRRRVLLLSFAGFLIVLGIPVFRELSPRLAARLEARRFIELMQEVRLEATASRRPVGLLLRDDRQAWQRLPFQPGDSCQKEAPAAGREWETAQISWKLQAQFEPGVAQSGKLLCWHPSRGLLLGEKPLGEGKLLASLLAAGETEPGEELAAVLVSQSGSEFHVVSY